MKTILTAILFFLNSFNAYAFDISLSGHDSIIIENSNHIKKMKFDTVINGYSVKCSGDIIVIWGKMKVINRDNPQDTNIIIINLKNYKTIEKGVSEGVFDVEYLKHKNLAYIGTSKGIFINLADGGVEEVESDFDPADDNNFELCDKNKSWEFNRYP